MCIPRGDARLASGSTGPAERARAALGVRPGRCRCVTLGVGARFVGRMRSKALAITLVAASLGFGCKSDSKASADATRDEDDKDASAPEPDAQPQAVEQPGVREDGSVVTAVDWFEGTLEDALERAKAEGKLVFMDVGAYWCPPCHRLDEEVFTDARVGEALGERYIAVHVDAEKGQGPELVDRYDVQAYPSLLVLEPSGIERGRVVDFLPPDALLAALDRIAQGHNVLGDLVAQVEAEPDDPKKRYELGHAYVLAARPEDAQKQFEAVLAADPSDELGLASQVLYDRAAFIQAKMRNDRKGAIESLEALRAKYPDSKAAWRAHRQIARMHHLLGDSDRAIAQMDRMLAEDPTDPALASNYGWFSFREKCHPERGLEVVEAALEENADDPELHYLRAELRHLTGDDAGALDAMRRASELEPKSAFYKRMVRRFEAMGGT